MTKLEQAARQALEALIEYRDTQMILAPRKAITALREALGNSLKPKCFADYQPNHAIDRACASCPVAAECQTGEQAEQEPVLMPVRRGTRITCMESDETCVVWTTSDTHAWVQFPDGQMGKYTYEQIGSYFSLDENYATDEAYERGLKEGIKAGKKIAEQAEQEPLLWGDDKFAPHERPQNHEPVAWAISHSLGLEFGSKYPMQETKEAAEQMARQHMGAVVVTPLYAAPVRTKDLTDEELWEAAKTAKSNDLTDAFRAVIAADREKNK